MSNVARKRLAPVTAVTLTDGFKLKSGSYAGAVHIMRTPAFRAELLGLGSLGFNTMALCPTLDGQPVTPEQLSACREACERSRGIRLSNQDLEQALLQVANENPYHPVQSDLLSCTWDGEERLAGVPALLGADPTPLNRAMLRKWFISAVARAMRPGCKVDTVLILVGPQGAGKSRCFQILGGSFFADTAIQIGDKDALLALHSAWIYEWAELESYQRARSANSVKAFISSSEDVFRPPYARSTGRYPRSCVVVGSTNDEQFLTDPTGGRRYWTIKVGQIDTKRIEEQRAQLWAEAFHAFGQNEPWHLTPEEDASLREVQLEHEVEDTWSASVLSFAATRSDAVTTADILTSMGKPVAYQQRADTMRVAAVLTRAGYSKRRLTSGDRPWVYFLPSNPRGLP